ncbi:MAG: nucleotidyl transferase AbiEii/AbiGii toxin family protein [Bacteroidales bacterium]|nr:nucleotidyl transferase AbiEii/AbiGii toxin family protein [Bacteroidales bacterium]MCF8456683.1 nucleotidyl transferase AbiEii/AbiGii toxin family protein [Bacteroidales bacterium]
MILKNSHTKEWIDTFRDKAGYNKSDPSLIEKMINALTLLEELTKSGLNFVFKGGTSLILMFENANRFSIDIDISTTENREDIEGSLDQVCDNSIFNKWDLDKKRSYREDLPKAHYKLYYNSVYNTNPKNVNANYVLLDIVYEEAVYPEIKEIEIKTKWLDTAEPYSTVKIPSNHSVLGDKLTAFAPNTTGILYYRNKQIEIIKQLFDVSFLINEVTDFQQVFDSFYKTAEKEIRYRGLKNDNIGILDDTFNTALLIALRERNSGDKRKFTEISEGLRNIQNFIISGNFRIDEAIEASAKAAWFAMKLKHREFSDMILYSNRIDIDSMQIEHTEYNYLNKLKKSNKPAFYYWHKCLELI